jgi:hypothetical protein
MIYGRFFLTLELNDSFVYIKSRPWAILFENIILEFVHIESWSQSALFLLKPPTYELKKELKA